MIGVAWPSTSEPASARCPDPKFWRASTSTASVFISSRVLPKRSLCTGSGLRSRGKYQRLDEVLAFSRLPAGVHGGPEVAVVNLGDASPEVLAEVAQRACLGVGARLLGVSGSR